ncbi:MAG: hypothetical protein QXN62_04880 [Candidatus Bathyarchaeia archaeon]
MAWYPVYTYWPWTVPYTLYYPLIPYSYMIPLPYYWPLPVYVWPY